MTPIDAYLEKVDPDKRAVLEHIRKLVKTMVPEVEEVISYGIPTLKYKGTYLIYFAAFKNHMSVFPGAPLRLKPQLEGYKLGKGTIQFTVDKPLPDSIIKELVNSRLDDITKGKKAYK
jgi:uncharacterized protein YdhG (YjbR/CyaY superfamily)